jgi:DNA-binding HxlR family transcriptional regulator
MDIKGIRGILRALSNEDALKIFSQADISLKRQTNNYKILGISKKRYYTRLRMLVKRGLLKRNRDEYRQTNLGKTVYDFLLNISEVVARQPLGTVEQNLPPRYIQSLIKQPLI